MIIRCTGAVADSINIAPGEIVSLPGAFLAALFLVSGTVFVRLYARGCGANVGMGVGVNVDAAIDIGSGPGMVIDEDGVSAPAEACAIPAEAAECRSDGDDWAEADVSPDEEAGARSVEDDTRTVNRDVVEGRVD